MTHVVLNKTYRSAEEISDRLVALVGENGGYVKPGSAAATEWHALNEARDEMNATQRRLRTAARRAGSTESIELGQPNFRREQSQMFQSRGEQARDLGLRGIERLGDLDNAGADRLEDLIERDSSGLEARYIEVVSRPEYVQAFAKRMKYRADASYVYTADEAQAMRDMSAVEAERTAMGVGTGSTGGFGVPAQLDPTIVLRSDGSVNPIRELASHDTISTSEWKGITSLGVSAEFTQERTEMAEATVTLEHSSRPSFPSGSTSACWRAGRF